MSTEKDEVFEFLVNLRDTGLSMGGATPYIVIEFGVTESEARELLYQWMKSSNN